MGSVDVSNYSTVLNGEYGEPYRFEKGPLPEPREGEAVVRIDFSGVCHGDVYSRDGGGPAPVEAIRPLIGGHEGIGEIISLGESVQKSAFDIGDLVGIAWRGWVCKGCVACRLGAENYCEMQKIVGIHRDGTFQRYVSFPVDQIVRIPASLDRAAACPILCAGVTAYTALQKMQPKKGKWCVIVGASGGLGHLAIQYAKYFGLKVVAIDGEAGESKRKEEFCRKMGCDIYMDYLKAGSLLSDEVKSVTDGGADYILVLGPHQSAYNAAADYAGFQGQIMAVGIANCHFPLRPILRKDLTLRSNQTGTKEDIEAAMQISASGHVECEIEVMKLSEINLALQRVKRGETMGKLVLDMRPETLEF